WCRTLKFLLLNRNAFWRHWVGWGTAKRATEVLKAANGLALPAQTAWAARLLCEYLDTSTGEYCPNFGKVFEELWETFSNIASNQWSHPIQIKRKRTIELYGIDSVKRLFEEAGRHAKFQTLLSILEAELIKTGKPSLWINFD